MGQTTTIFPQAKKIYRTIFHSPTIDRFVQTILNSSTSFAATILGWSFPKKFNWDWKLEMLLHRYERETVMLFQKMIKPGMCIVDIGAHIGYYTVLFSKMVGPNGRVIAFEADPDNFALLQKNTRTLSNVVLVNKAVTDQNGSIDFYKINNSTGCHSIIAPTLASTKTTVPAVTLDAFLENGAYPNIDTIKIDIEGGEPSAFRGMKKLFAASHPLQIVSEFNPAALTAAKVAPLDFLKSVQESGFVIYPITDSTEPAVPLTLEKPPSLSFYQTGYANLLLKK